jgi:signal transduction histidine kinase
MALLFLAGAGSYTGFASTQVLLNLLGNAAKFSRHVERPLVRVSGRHDVRSPAGYRLQHVTVTRRTHNSENVILKTLRDAQSS